MNISEPFILRPVATTLLTLGVALAGAIAFFQLPVSPLPQVDYPTISVTATLPGASPEVVASSVATPLERHLGQIADVTEMTSTSTVGSTRITLQFGLSRDIDGAARDVQAAINAARADLPTSLRSNPTYRKVNPADAPILILALTSDVLSPGQIYDVASTVLEQKLSQVEGIGQVNLSGSSLPAVRVELNPNALFKYGIGLEDVRAALSAANAHSPKGAIEQDDLHYQIYDNDQARAADAYRSLIVAYHDGAPVRLSDIGEVSDSVENLRNAGLANGKPAVLVILNRSPGANIIDAVDRVIALLPELKASMPSSIDVSVAVDRSTTIRASLHEVERTLLIAICLVIGVVFCFLRSGRATLIPSVAVPVSLIGTFGVMYLLNYSLDNLSLMALTIATGFVVDDAIVVLENVSRHMEAGMPRLQAALQGAREVGFTVVSMSLSLIAVFIPILLMGTYIGRLFREFAMTLSIAIIVSLVVSLTTTPMMCARLLKVERERRPGWLSRGLEAGFDALLGFYQRTLRSVLAHPLATMFVLLVTLGLNVYLFDKVPKGLFPQQDTGRIIGGIQADQSISFQAMRQKLTQFISIVQKDPAVDHVVGFTGGFQTNSGFLFMALKPLSERETPVNLVIARLRRQLADVPGASLFLLAVQDLRVGGRQTNAEYQYTLQGDSLTDLNTWTPRIVTALQALPELADVNSDQQVKGLETDLVVDRLTASRLGITASQIDNTLYDAFGQRQVSTIYNPLNQYHVVMEVAPQYWQSPEMLNDIYISTSGGAVGGVQGSNAVAGTFVAPSTASGGKSQSSGGSAPTLPNTTAPGTGTLATSPYVGPSSSGPGGSSASSASTSTASSAASTAATAASDEARNLATNNITAVGHGAASTGSAVSTRTETMIPLAAISSFQPGATPLAVNHQGPFVANTISFNLPPGVTLGQAEDAVNRTMNEIGVPSSIHGSFQGTAQLFQQLIANEYLLIAAALIAVYIVLGVLYESYIHPLTILSTLPSAGVGAVLALMICDVELSIIALIGVILLIGIVKKNAIMMIDFALDVERNHGLSSREAIYQACLLRFRPIMMTTMAALLGALPLAIGAGEGGELRQPLGISIVGGLLVSQVLTLYTTPVVYLYLDRLRLWALRRREPRPGMTAGGGPLRLS